MKEIKELITIYLQRERLKPSARYFNIIINEIYFTIKNNYGKKDKSVNPEVIESFEKWLSNYWNLKRNDTNKNDVIFDMKNERDFCKSIIITYQE